MTYLLVHGAGMGTSCWERLVPYLDTPAYTVDLPWRGTRADVDVRAVTLEMGAQAIIEDVPHGGERGLVVVAHSVPRVLMDLADRLKHVEFLSAVVPEDGTAAIDQTDLSVREVVEESIAGGVYSPDAVGLRATLCNDMDYVTTVWTVSRDVDDSASLLTERVDLFGLAADVLRTYIRLMRDACDVPELQGHSAEGVGGEVRWLGTGHMPVVSAPESLAGDLSGV